ncbi:hypothetical protein ACTQYZ_05710 [Anaerofustis sp. LCP19S3_F7]|uniref:hypothetical protein n=1 Tax=Anaerofustis sp. LCP19S3_F7 TaxID=3440247 RepID=UPI003F904B73
MNYRIEKTGEFTIIAKRTRYGGGKEISNKNIKKLGRHILKMALLKNYVLILNPIICLREQ